MTLTMQERRRFIRLDLPARVSINLLEPDASGPVTHVNYSEGGLCLRLTQALEVRSRVRMQLRPEDAAQRPMELTGRVAWVMQRLDLRTSVPQFDIGIEFTDALLKQQKTLSARVAGRTTGGKRLEPVSLSGRMFVPQLERVGAPQGRWHLVVAVEGVPCFSGHYESERAAMLAWTKFKTSQARVQAKRARA